MCKVAMVSKITEKNRDDVWVFMQLLGQVISAGNNDGLGYAAIDKNGKIFGEKWLINETAFQDLSRIKDINSSKMERIYNCFGDEVKRDDAQAIILHTRAATCGRCIQNTHPFVDDNADPTVAIIHNGMIYNEKQFPRKYSTCDSEVLAHLYKSNDVAADLGNLNKFTKELEGWYTVLCLSKTPSGKLVMDAFTDNGRLGSFYIKELDTRIWSSWSHDVKNVANSLGLTAVDEMDLKAETALRIDVMTGKPIVHQLIKTLDRNLTPKYGPSMWDNVSVMEGNLDDAEFRERWFSKRWPLGD